MVFTEGAKDSSGCSAQSRHDSSSQHGDASTRTAPLSASYRVLSEAELKSTVKVHVSERLGGGSSARVYRASLDGLPVAMKVQHPHAARREHNVQEFLREAELLHKLQHRNIVELFGVCQVPPAFSGLPTRRYTWAMLLELMEGGSLASVISKQSERPEELLYSDSEALAWCLDIAGALEVMHSQSPPIIHRDVKPENVLMTLPGPGMWRVAKLADMGLHVALEPHLALSRHSSGVSFESLVRNSNSSICSGRGRPDFGCSLTGADGRRTSGSSVSALHERLPPRASRLMPQAQMDNAQRLGIRPSSGSLSAGPTRASAQLMQAEVPRRSLQLSEVSDNRVNTIPAATTDGSTADRPRNHISVQMAALKARRNSFFHVQPSGHSLGSLANRRRASNLMLAPSVSSLFEDDVCCGSASVDGLAKDMHHSSGSSQHVSGPGAREGPQPWSGTLAIKCSKPSTHANHPPASSNDAGAGEQHNSSATSAAGSTPIHSSGLVHSPSQSPVAAVEQLHKVVKRLRANAPPLIPQRLTSMTGKEPRSSLHAPMVPSQQPSTNDSLVGRQDSGDEPSSQTAAEQKLWESLSSSCAPDPTPILPHGMLRATASFSCGAALKERRLSFLEQRRRSVMSVGHGSPAQQAAIERAMQSSSLHRAGSSPHGYSVAPSSYVSESEGGLSNQDVYSLTGGAGTSIYKAPEIVQSEPYNAKADIYSLAIVMFEIFSRHIILGERSGPEIEEMCNNMLAGERPRRPPNMDMAVWQIIRQCWNHEPEARPTASQLVHELMALQSVPPYEKQADEPLNSKQLIPPQLLSQLEAQLPLRPSGSITGSKGSHHSSARGSSRSPAAAAAAAAAAGIEIDDVDVEEVPGKQPMCGRCGCVVS